MDKHIRTSLMAVSIAAILGTFAAAYVFSIQAAFAQQSGLQGTGQPGTTTAESHPRKGLNFFLKLNDDQTGTTSTKPLAPMAAQPIPPTGTAGTDNATRHLMINASIVQAEGKRVRIRCPST